MTLRERTSNMQTFTKRVKQDPEKYIREMGPQTTGRDDSIESQRRISHKARLQAHKFMTKREGKKKD